MPALTILQFQQKRSAPARPLYGKQPMADGQGTEFILSIHFGKVSAAKSRW